MAVFSGPEISNDGLVLHLDAANPLSYPGSGSTWYDLSGVGSNGTFVNGVNYSSDNNGILVFDGVDDYCRISESIPSSSNFSVEFWFNPADISSGQNLIYSSSENSYTFRFYRNSPWGEGTFSWLMYYEKNNNTVGSVINYSMSYEINNWYSTSISVESIGVLRTFQNGNLIYETDRSSDFLGWYYPNNYFDISKNLKVSSFKIYNKALSPEEVKQNFEAHRDRYGI